MHRRITRLNRSDEITVEEERQGHGLKRHERRKRGLENRSLVDRGRQMQKVVHRLLYAIEQEKQGPCKLLLDLLRGSTR